MTKDELIVLQSYPLDVKIAKSKQRIREWVEHFGEDGVYISFSGGKDSTVLLDLVRSEYPNVLAVYCDTGLEFPEVKEFIKTFDNVEIIRPKKSFREVIVDYGYPVVSKEVSNKVSDIRNTKSEKLRQRRLYGRPKDGAFKLPKKWHYLLDMDFKISDRCCYHLKKSPFRIYENKSKRVPILGNMACESMLRETWYLKFGCNAFDKTKPSSTPLGFWTEQDIFEYIVENNLEIAPVYGEIKQRKDGTYYMDGRNRTGCVFCGYGCHLEPKPNRYQQLEESHIELYNYCINGGAYNDDGIWEPNNKGLGFGKVLDDIGIEYKIEDLDNEFRRYKN